MSSSCAGTASWRSVSWKRVRKRAITSSSNEDWRRVENIVVEGYHKLTHGMKVEPVVTRREEETEKQQ